MSLTIWLVFVQTSEAEIQNCNDINQVKKKNSIWQDRPFKHVKQPLSKHTHTHVRICCERMHINACGTCRRLCVITRFIKFLWNIVCCVYTGCAARAQTFTESPRSAHESLKNTGGTLFCAVAGGISKLQSRRAVFSTLSRLCLKEVEWDKLGC